MAKSIRTVRFSEAEIERIERFLAQNPVFDFSRLVRMAVDRFVENPDIKIRPLKRSSRAPEQEV